MVHLLAPLLGTRGGERLAARGKRHAARKPHRRRRARVLDIVQTPELQLAALHAVCVFHAYLLEAHRVQCERGAPLIVEVDVARPYERACGKAIPYEIKPRRAGDIAENYAACDKARQELGWVAEYDLDRMCADSWRWQSNNPDGYATA